ncbi:hypothetical protein FVEN_g12848 [Fusarium venenatum]|nr:hypothetical protein FVEN_g12848 [Fusarium venenatum]
MWGEGGNIASLKELCDVRDIVEAWIDIFEGWSTTTAKNKVKNPSPLHRL